MTKIPDLRKNGVYASWLMSQIYSNKIICFPGCLDLFHRQVNRIFYNIRVHRRHPGERSARISFTNFYARWSTRKAGNYCFIRRIVRKNRPAARIYCAYSNSIHCTGHQWGLFPTLRRRFFIVRTHFCTTNLGIC